MSIDLTRPLNLPMHFVHRLNAVNELCREHRFSEDLVDIPEVSILVRDLDAYCCESEIIGIHYTRAIPERIKNQGLLIRSGCEICKAFLAEHGHRFTSDEISLIKERWDGYFTEEQYSARDNRIFFNFTESALENGSAKYLIGRYGGEQVTMFFEFDEPIGIKLSEIGIPVVVRCAIKSSDMNTYIRFPWGKILFSEYHLSINPNAYGIDQDGYQSIPVDPEKIIEVKEITSKVSGCINA